MIGAYLVDTIVLRQDKGMDKWQTPNTPTDLNVRAFIDYGEHRIQNEAGEIVVSMAKVYMLPRDIIVTDFATRATNTISYKDKVIFDGMEHAIVRITKGRDFSVRSMNVYVT
jgi:hypothetical protein